MISHTARFYLLLNALLYVVFGIWCALDPYWTAQAVGFTLPANQGYAEYVAVYGGLEFGVGIFFLLCARTPAHYSMGILFGTCFYLGICLFRTFAITRVGFDIGAGINFYATECFFALWSLALFFSSSPTAKS